MKKFIIGIDEVGRGSWAGPLFFGAVCFMKNVKIPPDVIIRDSKALNRAQRARSSYFLRKNSIFSITPVPKGTIDDHGLQKATVLGLHSVIRKIRLKIIASLPKKERENLHLHYKIDGNRICRISESHEFIVRGDATVKEISAASIIAKVARDRLLIRLSKVYPEYGFEHHVGYGTQRHQQALKEHGVCPIHRTSYVPIKKIMEAQNKVMHRNKGLFVL